MSSRIPSPARSQGTKPTPRKYKRGPRSVGSPAQSNTSVKLSAVIQDSFALSPLPRRSVLTDTTDIDVPGRRSWWKKLDENSIEVMEVFSTNEPAENNNAIEEYIDVDILSQEKEKKNYTLDFPDSSDGESISSIVIPQRKLFTQKDNQAQNKFGKIIDKRETLAKLHKTQAVDERALNVAPKNLFNQGTKTRTKPIFPAALLNISANKTLANKTKELAANEAKGQVKNLFGNRAGTKRKNVFADFIVSDSEEDISEIQPKVFGFQKKPGQKHISKSRGQCESSLTSSVNESEIDDWRHLPSSTMVEHQLEDALITTPNKKARLSKLTEVGESVNTESILNKTKPSNKSISSKNKSKSKSHKYIEAMGNEIINDNEELQTSKQNNTHNLINDEKTNRDVGIVQREQAKNEEMQGMLDENLGEEIANDKQNQKRRNINSSLYSNKNESQQNVDNLDKIVDSEQNYVMGEPQNHEDIITVEEHQRHDERVEMEIDKDSSKINNSKAKLNLKNKSINKNHSNLHEVDEAVSTTQNNEHDNDIHKDNDEIVNNSEDRIKILDIEARADLQNDEDQNVSEEIQNYEDNDGNENESEKLEVQEDTQKSNESECEVAEDDDDEIDNEEVEADQNRSKNRSQKNVDNSSEEESPVQNENQDESDDNEKQEQMSDQNVSRDVEGEVQASSESENEDNDDEDERNIENDEIGNQEECEPSQDNVIEEEIHNEDDEEHDVNENIELKYEEDQCDQGVGNDVENIDEDIEEDNIHNQSEDNQSETHKESEINVSHDTTGRYRKKTETQIKSPEAILHDKTNQMESFTAQGRNTSVRKTKSIIKNLNVRPSLAPVRESTGMDGTRDSSMDASGWDSHRVTRKTLRQTLGKDFTPRKSLRALVMEKSAKRHTNFTDINVEISRLPQANSTELPEPFDMDEEDDDVQGSAEEASKRVEQTSEVDGVEKMQESEKELSNRTRRSSDNNPEKVQQSDHDLSNELENENGAEEPNNELLNRTHKSTEVEDDNRDETDESDHEQSNRTRQSTEIEDAYEEDKFDHEVSNKTRQSTEVEDHDEMEESNQEQTNSIRQSTEVEDHGEMEESDHEQTNSTRQSTEVEDDNEMEESDHDLLDKTQESTDGEDENEAEESDHELSNRTRHSNEVDEENDLPEIDQEWSKRTNQTSEIDEAEHMRESAHGLSNRTRHSTEVVHVTEMEVSEHEVSNRTRNSAGVDDAQDMQESEHEFSKRTRQTTLEMYLQNIKKQNIEKKRQMEEQIRNSLKAPRRDVFNPFKVPAKPLRRMKVPQTKPKMKPLKSSVIPLDMLPEEVLQDMKYKPPKRYQPANASWITKRLYKFLETKLEAKYDYKARVRAEKLVETIYNFTKDIRRHDVAPTDAVNVLKHEMARLEIVKTHFEFYEFFHDYMPREIRIKVVPDVVNKISLPRHGVFSNILR